MAYRKFMADFMFDGGELLPAGSVLIIKDDAIVVDIVNALDAGDDIETFRGMVVPGFINAHCHLELSHMKNLIAPGSGLVPFLTRVIKERNFLASSVNQAMAKAEDEMYMGGIVACGDICNTTDSILLKKNSLIEWHNFIEVIGFTKEKAGERLAQAGKVLTAFQRELPLGRPQQEEYDPVVIDHRLLSSITPHAPYSVSEALFELINEVSSGKIISIHNQESPVENNLYESGTGQVFELYGTLNINASFFKASGKSSLQTFLPWLQKASRIILVHNTYSDETDIVFSKSFSDQFSDLYFCICINANRYIETKNPPLDLLRKFDCSICLGTDSYASNWNLKILEEIKTIQQQFPHIPLPEILQWATMNGAKALNMDDRFGSFEAGKKPGVVLIDRIEDGKVCDDAVARRIF